MIEQAKEADLKEKFEETQLLLKRVKERQKEKKSPYEDDVQRIGQNLCFFKVSLPRDRFIALTQQGFHLAPATTLDYLSVAIRKDGQQ